MQSSLAIGDFSRATHLNIKALRHYHRIGLLEPAYVDPATGHRRYGTGQIPTAQVIRRFRALDMPLEEIHAVITTPDLAARNELIAGHLRRLETTLARTQQAAASLRDLLEPPADATPVAIEHRRIPATPAAAVSEVIDVKEAGGWYPGRGPVAHRDRMANLPHRPNRRPGHEQTRLQLTVIPGAPTSPCGTSWSSPSTTRIWTSRMGVPVEPGLRSRPGRLNEHFFLIYKELEPGKSVEGASWAVRSAAQAEASRYRRRETQEPG
ncbi:MAG: MerR family transcriptional regulator [Streptosporangiaceae bacterium]